MWLFLCLKKIIAGVSSCGDAWGSPFVGCRCAPAFLFEGGIMNAENTKTDLFFYLGSRLGSIENLIYLIRDNDDHRGVADILTTIKQGIDDDMEKLANLVKRDIGKITLHYDSNSEVLQKDTLQKISIEGR